MNESLADNEKYIRAISLINDEQTKIIGENISKIIMSSVKGLTFTKSGTPEISGDPKKILNDLVTQYSTLFGMASIMVSKEAIKKVSPSFSANELPDNLR